ncbi:unnamed protein product [Ceutorhynchus assimilis]|uniref:C2H2-type domain-containing protein n=1 Tax=Ceutorhynchus assimilis TaxID=467358 RepID=A0A9N9MYM5_9CUCU|nr:unnamed protein product [Ceutorhynchus assimilis]
MDYFTESHQLLQNGLEEESYSMCKSIIFPKPPVDQKPSYQKESMQCAIGSDQSIFDLDSQEIAKYDVDGSGYLSPKLQTKFVKPQLNYTEHTFKLQRCNVQEVPFAFEFIVQNQSIQMNRCHYFAPAPTLEKVNSKPTQLQEMLQVVPTTNLSDQKIKCFLCDREFTRSCYLTQHINALHSGNKPFRCAICGKKFARDFDREEHQKRHNGIKRFQCDQCPKTFNYKMDLTRHNVLHTGKKLHKCQVCDKYFIRRDQMVKHLSTHNK